MRIRIPYILFLLSLLLNACEKEEGDLMVFTGEVNLSQYDNIEFNGRIQFSDNVKIIDHGFLFPNFGKISLGETDNPGNFNHTFSQILNPGYTQSVVSFAETEDGVFFGNRVSFKPLELEFKKIYPSLLYFNDTLTLEGKRLLPENNELRFYLNDVLCEAVLKTNEKIQVIVPESIDYFQLKLKVSIGPQEFEHGIILNMKTPVIESIEKRKGESGDTIIIRGNYLGNTRVTSVSLSEGSYGGAFYWHKIDQFTLINKNTIIFVLDDWVPEYPSSFIKVEVMGKMVRGGWWKY